MIRLKLYKGEFWKSKDWAKTIQFDQQPGSAEHFYTVKEAMASGVQDVDGEKRICRNGMQYSTGNGEEDWIRPFRITQTKHTLYRFLKKICWKYKIK